MDLIWYERGRKYEVNSRGGEEKKERDDARLYPDNL
jgi:hypothetical protein